MTGAYAVGAKWAMCVLLDAYAALAMARLIQNATGLSIKRFLRTLKFIQTGVVLINGKKREVRPILSNEAVEILKLLEARCGS
ncbi:MAG: hypothetical protein FWF91_08795 [Coriobacteriia bacterium]|nr:hypothetical protein [Coriobacteriia bacterium]